jgi:hypothetical protein
MLELLMVAGLAASLVYEKQIGDIFRPPPPPAVPSQALPTASPLPLPREAYRMRRETDNGSPRDESPFARIRRVL